jgi:hypothetical protein
MDLIICKTRKWGNSVGIILPKSELERLGVEADDEIIVDIARKENPLKELFGAFKGKKIGRADIKQLRALMESKY